MTPAPTLHARWGIRQVKDGVPTGGGTVGWGWATREEAEAANPRCRMTLGYHGRADAGTIRLLRGGRGVHRCSPPATSQTLLSGFRSLRTRVRLCYAALSDEHPWKART